MKLTPNQRRAVETVGRSVIVSAAAGAGKTSVLAQRCAYLVCNAPDQWRCDVDELLVLTFTDAAAAEMRGRIVQALSARLEAAPADDRLRRQVALAETAHISTVHAFCAWIIRRWFSEAGVDPGATVLDADEATLLKQEVLEALFAKRYAAEQRADDPSGRLNHPAQSGAANPSPKRQRGDQPPVACAAGAFHRLIDDYGLGDDRDVVGLILKLAEFVNSLPDPDGWLFEARDSLTAHPKRVLLAHLASVSSELKWQKEHCTRIADSLADSDPACRFLIEQIRAYADAVGAWADLAPRTDAPPDETLARFDSLRAQIADYPWRGRAPTVRDDSTKGARDRASQARKQVKETLFQKRLRDRFCLFSTEEWLAGLSRIAPYVHTIVEVVGAFRRAYAAHKHRLGVLDFSDLERFAFDVLRADGDSQGSRPSDVARVLHRKFAHVLVDEFQDINPIQEAIIRLVSREFDPEQADNLFVVGDVKQSIYRFRLAEPGIFTQRLEAFGSKTNPSEAIFLQENFRSRREVLDAANLVFSALMRPEVGGITYDKQARLKPGRTPVVDDSPTPVELHLLERRWDDTGSEEDQAERNIPDRFDPARWQPIEREAFLIGSRIRTLMESEEIKPNGEPLRYRDCAVLLRTTKVNAEQVASILSLMGIPAYAGAGGSLFGALEIKDVLAFLQVLDNVQQDIPLAAVLRGGLLGERLSEDDLVEIRCLDRGIPFHAVVRRYAGKGERGDLREHLGTIFARIDGYRDAIRRHPLAEVLWRFYEESGYLAYVGGLPNGAQRRANLLALHERARQFGTFRRQGLHRFLRFIESLQELNQDLGAAPAIGEAEDVVRVMSIHQSKGLEFPVVFLAGLGTKFNLGDRTGRMIFEREAKIGLRAVDPDRMIEYPTCAHLRAAAEIERQTRAEEMRILYVGMTRARDKLVLIGSASHVHRLGDSPLAEAGDRLTLLQTATAETALAWLMPALASAPAGRVRWPGDRAAATPWMTVRLYEPEEMRTWTLGRQGRGAHDDSRRRVAAAVAGGAPLPPDEPTAPDDPVVEEVVSRIEYVYPTLASASLRAVMGASEFKGRYDFTTDPDARPPGRPGAEPFEIPPSRYVDEEPMTAARRGTVTHRVLQHLDFTVACDSEGVASELLRMERARLITRSEADALDREALTWFVGTDLCAAIRGAGDGYRREVPYIASEPPDVFDSSVDELEEESVLVRGIVDGILPVDGGIEIIDFKTDAIDSAEVPERACRYESQMMLYARAMERIFKQPVRARKLVFLTPRRVVTLTGAQP